MAAASSEEVQQLRGEVAELKAMLGAAIELLTRRTRRKPKLEAADAEPIALPEDLEALLSRRMKR